MHRIILPFTGSESRITGFRRVIYIVLFIILNSLFIIQFAYAAGSMTPCTVGSTACPTGESCLPDPASTTTPPAFNCQTDVFGQIKPPDQIKNFIGLDPTGAVGISQFLSNLIKLFYAVAAIVLIFMLLWGGFDWITSEGDKEKLSSAQKKIINAIIGIIIFGVAFALIQVLGAFTGFTFFVGQK